VATEAQMQIVAVLKDLVSKGVLTMAANVDKSQKKVQESTSKSTKSLAEMAKGFMSVEIAAKAIRGMAEAMKQFERSAGGDTISKMSNQFGQLQVEIGSVLMPVMKEFSDWWEKNQTEISTAARLIVKAVSTGLALVKDYFLLVTNSIKAAITGLVGTVTGAVGTIMGKLAELTGDKGLKAVAKGFKDVETSSWSQMEKYTAGVSDNIFDIGKNLVGFGQFDATKWSGVGFKSQQEIDAEKQAAEERKRAAAERKRIAEKEYADQMAMRARALKDAEAYQLRSNELQMKILGQSMNAREFEFMKLGMLRQKEQEQELKYYQQGMMNAGNDAIIKEGLLQKHYEAMMLINMSYEEDVLALSRQYRDIGYEIADESAIRINNMLHDRMVGQIMKVKNAEEEKQQFYQDTIDTVSSANSTFFGALSNLWSYQSKVLDIQTEKQKRHAQDTIKDKKKLDAEIAKIEDQARARRIEIRRKELITQLAMAVANTAEGITKAIAQGGVLGLVTGIAVGAAGAIQTAVIADQMNNMGSAYATGGIVPGTSYTGDQVPARVNSGEMILNQAQQARLYNMANGKGSSGGDIVIHESITVSGNLDHKAASQVRDDRERQLTRLRQDLKELNWRGQLSYA